MSYARSLYFEEAESISMKSICVGLELHVYQFFSELLCKEELQPANETMII